MAQNSTLRLLKGPLGFIVATMFLNFAGLTIIIPVIPYIVEKYTSNVALYVGLIMSVASLCQFLASPALGYLSDIFGRRPVLLWSLVGGTIGFILFGIGGSLWMLFLARIIDGATAGDTPAMYAYVADTVEPHERGKLYGILGAAGGVGFMVGPAVGGLAAQWGHSMPLYVAAALSLLNAAVGFFVMKESLPKEKRVKKFQISHINPLLHFAHIFESLPLRILFAATFLFFTGLIMQQSNISVFMKETLNFGPGQIGIVLTLVGVVDIFSQGFLTGKLLPKLGEMKLVLIGLVITALGELMVGSVDFFRSAWVLYAAVIIYDIGDGLFEPAMSSFISHKTEPHMQGRVQGANQSTQAVARVIAPLIAAGLYQFAPFWPYAGTALFMAASFAALILFRGRLRTAKA